MDGARPSRHSDLRPACGRPRRRPTMRALIVQHVACEGPGLLGHVLQARGVTLDSIRSDRGETIPRPDTFDMLVVLGGPMHVQEEADFPFLAAEVLAIRGALAAGVPFLGIGLGGQLLARALGARVRTSTAEIGFSTVSLTPAASRDAVFARVPHSFPVFQWHGDTFDIPTWATHLASSRACERQAFSVSGSAYALQFHLELTRPMIEEWLERYATGPLAEARDRILKDVDTRLDAMHAVARSVFSNFLALVTARHRAR